jgi:hypothetical protein
MVGRQRAARIEFMQTLKLQDSARNKTLEAQEAAKRENLPAARGYLTDSSIQETTVSSQCAKSAATILAIAEEMDNNRIEEMLASDRKDKAAASVKQTDQLRSDVIEPLGSLQDLLARQVAALNLAATRSDPAQVREESAAIAQAQQDILKQMEAIAQRMQKIESRADIAHQVELLIGWSKELLGEIQKQKEAGIESIFSPTTNPAGAPK